MNKIVDDLFTIGVGVVCAPFYLTYLGCKKVGSFLVGKETSDINSIDTSKENASANNDEDDTTNNNNSNNNKGEIEDMNNKADDNKIKTLGLVKHNTIKNVKLVYPYKIKQQIFNISKILNYDKFAEFQKRMNEVNYGSGYIALFYGAPGTGKTESVLQIAKNCRRDIYKVDMADIQSKYISETGIKVRNTFKTYENLCKDALAKKKPIPILLLNEADALLGKRHKFDSCTNPISVQDNNSTQNILLEEFENNKGIIFLTTNIAGNFDYAFERRIFDKVKFDIPDIGTRKKIWKIMFPNLTFEEINLLASKFNFTGGDINLIARNAIKAYVVNGKHPSCRDIYKICKETKIKLNQNYNK